MTNQKETRKNKKICREYLYKINRMNSNKKYCPKKRQMYYGRNCKTDWYKTPNFSIRTLTAHTS